MAEKKVSYHVDGRPFEGIIVYDDSASAKRPAIFMQPDWKGVCADTIAQARTVAGKDYVVLMADMFGAGYGAKAEDAGRFGAPACSPCTTTCRSPSLAAPRPTRRCFAEANKLGLVEVGKNAAIGYCAGGGFALEQARAGADFKAVVVFHVTNPNPVVAGTPCNIKGRVLAIHGSGRPVTPKPMMDAFEAETDKRQDRLAGDDVRRRRPFVLRSDRGRRPVALRRKALPQVLQADARLFRRNAVSAAR